ncbi:MAG: TIGR03621 family F420-dependent LLM class oxidoreductase [Acidimicrobiia bacterium]
MTRPFRFGIQAATAVNRSAWVELARRVENHGYATLTMPDHFSDQLAPVPALMSAADATIELRIGALVFDNDFRHPVTLAKDLATLDVLSDGRLEIGLGAGWQRTDYDQSGIGYDPPGVRIDRMVEGLTVMRGLFGEGPFSIEGRHYQLNGIEGWPKPIQAPCPPVLLGGGGRRMLTVAGQLADIVGVNGTLTSGTTDLSTFESMTAGSVDAKVGYVVDAATAAGRLDEIERNVRVFFVSVTNSRDEVIAGLSAFTGMPVAEIEASPFVLVGSVAKIAEDLIERRERWGFSYVIVGAEQVDEFAPVVTALAMR